MPPENPLEKLTITGYSTALFSTWYFVSELNLLFDCGDGVCSHLLQKAGKIRHVFVSHADRDHVTGLLRFNELNSRQELCFHYPKDCGTFPALAEFTQKFDHQVPGAKWNPLKKGDETRVRGDIVVRSVENAHVAGAGERTKSLSFFVDRVSRKLKPEFGGKSGTELQQYKQQHGEESISEVSRKTILAYSGDTPIVEDGRFNNVETLIHEATFLSADELGDDKPFRNKHSSLDQVMKMVANSNIERLVLGHFSSRYNAEEIDAAIKKECKSNLISIPVYRIHPGICLDDILNSTPVNALE